MFALVVGAGHTGQHVAETLLREGHSVVIVEKSHDTAQKLSVELADRVVEGDAADP